MKTSFLGKFTFGASLLLLPLLGACTPPTSSPPSPTNSMPAVTNTVSVVSTDAAPAMEIVSAPIYVPPDTGTVSVAPDNATTANGLAPNIYPTSPLAQVIRLSQAGVDESIILTFIANAGSTFNLDSDKIIYLKDIGLPNDVVTAMMQHDQQLLQQMAAASQTALQPASPETTPETEPAPTPAEQPAAPPTAVTINNFYDTLAPYGSWITVDGYGRCWRPSVVVYNPGWQPYCDHGRWIYTDCGWYWSSDYSWGWAPFHYGRWFRHSNWGWCWTPDTIWGPSWVTWRYSSGYCGWAPLPPYAAYRAGLGFYYRGGAVSIGFNWGLSENCFTFVPTQYFCDSHPRRRCLPPAQVTQIFNQTAVINNFHVRDHDHSFVNRGIEPERITAVTRTPIRPVSIQTTTAPPGQGPRGDQLSRDGSTLLVNHPSRTGFPAQNRPPQREDNRSVAPARPVQQPQVPVVNTRNPQESGAIRVPPQRPAQPSSPPANHNPSPAQNNGNRTYSPRQWEQNQSSGAPRANPNNSGAPAFTPPSRPGPSGASESGRRSVPATAPAPQQPQRSQPSSPPPAPSAPRSSGQNQNQNSFGNNPGNNFGSGAGNGPGSGPRR